MKRKETRCRGYSFLVVALAAWLSLLPYAAARAEESSALARRRSQVVEVFEGARGAVVNISATQFIERSPFGDLFDEIFESHRLPRLRYKVRSVGSGFVIHRDGYIITNAHVVLRTQDPQVIFADKSRYDADIVRIDEEHDLAVLQIKADHSLPHLKLGRSDDLMVGEAVVAIGNPFGYQNTVTAGIVSALDRELHFSKDGRDMTYRGLIQTDAAINPGNSGGPLLNVLGELVGINTAIRGDAQNMSFAIPVDQLRALLPSLLSPEQLNRVQVGLRVGGRKEMMVVEVVDPSPAAEAGIQPGDTILSIDGMPLEDTIDFYCQMLSKKAGQIVTVKLARNEEQRRVLLKLQAVPKPDGAALARERLGLELKQISTRATARLNLLVDSILVITAVEPDSPGGRIDLRPDDVLWQLGGVRGPNFDQVGEILNSAHHGDVLYISVVRFRGRMGYSLHGQIEVR